MHEECIVEKIKGKTVYISLKKLNNCGGCKACVFGKNKSNIVPAISNIDCNVGDTVRVSLSKDSTMSGSIVIYLLPILALFLGFFVGSLFKNDILEAVLAIIFCSLSFIPIYLIDKKYKKFMPVVIELIKCGKENKENL